MDRAAEEARLRTLLGRVRLLHLDENVVAVSKPSGLLVHRTSEARDRTVLLQAVGDRVGRRVYPVHRLDRGVSGVVLFGLSSEDARWLQRSLAAGEKRYLALVRGRPEEEGLLDRPLRDERGVRREARTRFRVLERFRHQCLVEVVIETGRRHQIRRHLSHAAHQILGDRSHGKGRLNRLFREKYGLERIFLHAVSVRLLHEPAGRELLVEDPLPEELERVLAALRNERDAGAQ